MTTVEIIEQHNTVEITNADNTVVVNQSNTTVEISTVGAQGPPGEDGAGATIDDTAHGAGWNGDITNIASKNSLYNKIESLSLEARQKLSQIRPATLGQASRISGINPSDISVLMVYIGR